MVVKKLNLKNGGPLCRLAAGFRSVNYVRWASRRATIGRNLRIRSYRAIPRKLRRHPHWPRVDRAEFFGSAYALFQRLRLRVGFGPTRLSSLASHTLPLTDVILYEEAFELFERNSESNVSDKPQKLRRSFAVKPKK